MVTRLLTAADLMGDAAFVDAIDPYQFLSVAGIARARPDAVIGVVLDGVTPRAAVGAVLTVRTGAVAGRELLSLGGGEGVIVAAGGRRNMSVGFEDVVVGDTVFVDNRDYLAYANFTVIRTTTTPSSTCSASTAAPCTRSARKPPVRPTSTSSRRTKRRSTRR